MKAYEVRDTSGLDGLWCLMAPAPNRTRRTDKFLCGCAPPR